MKPNSPAFRHEFLCPISLELMTDPVIVATGQTYERSCIQKWIQSGHRTCPKTQQILQHTDLIPNYALRSLIEDWCKSNSVELSNRSSSSRSGEASRSQIDKSGDPATVNVLLQKLASGSPENQREAAGELRLLSKTDAENRISIAEGGAIPLLVNLLSTPDATTQEHAVTALLNLSISENNKGAIVMAGGISPIVEVLKNGRMQARENAAAALFSLSALEDNKSVIGESDAIPALVGLLSEGSQRGKKDAASALFNLSIYRDNKARAVRAGAVGPLMQLLVDPSAGMVGEGLTTVAILAGHPEGIMAIGNAEAITILVDLIRTGCPRNRENAAVVLLALCKTDPRHLVTARRERVSEPLTDLVENGTERAQRKATSLLELISKSEQADLISRAQQLRVISDSE